MGGVWRTAAPLFLLATVFFPPGGGAPAATSPGVTPPYEVALLTEVAPPGEVSPGKGAPRAELAPEAVVRREVTPVYVTPMEVGPAEVTPVELVLAEVAPVELVLAEVASVEEVMPKSVVPAVTITATTTTSTKAPTKSQTTDPRSHDQEISHANQKMLFIGIGVVVGAIVIIFFICVVEMSTHNKRGEGGSRRGSTTQGYSQLPTEPSGECGKTVVSSQTWKPLWLKELKLKELKPLATAKLGNPPSLSSDEEDELFSRTTEK